MRNTVDSSYISACDIEKIGRIYCSTTSTPTPIPYYPPPEGCYNPIDNFSGNACPYGFAEDAGGGYCCQTGEPENPICPDNDADGWTTCAGDCRDFDADSYPGAPRWCGIGGYWDKDCSGYDDELECIGSPVVIDTSGDGFDLTNAANGVLFDLNSDGIKERLAWTSANSDDAWLALDRDGNNSIDSGRELFGNFTAQPVPPAGEERNGFLALAEYDKAENGGNADGSLTAQDAIFLNLRLWQDTNHNGISETNELKTLNELGLTKMELDYKKSKRTDAHGNEFRYRAKVKDARGAQAGRWAWDVFLKSQ